MMEFSIGPLAVSVSRRQIWGYDGVQRGLCGQTWGGARRKDGLSAPYGRECLTFSSGYVFMCWIGPPRRAQFDELTEQAWRELCGPGYR
jgi:hypothetical protein